MKIDLTKNHGYLEGSPTETTDYVLGVSSPIVFEQRNSTGNWDKFLGITEKQLSRNLDRSACVTYSALNSVEAQINWMLVNNLVPAEGLKFLQDNGYLVENQCNLSDRYIAKLSDTTPAGNYFTKVWDTIRHEGCVPEDRWPDNPDFTWDGYYSNVPDEIKKLGQEFLKYFSIQYEALQSPTVSNLAYSLQHAPIQLAVATCSPWDTNVPVCGARANHAILLYNTSGQAYGIFDSYDPFRKTLMPGYRIYSAIKGIVSPIKEVKQPLFSSIDNLIFGKTNGDVKLLQKLLKVIEPQTGYFGRLTQGAVFSFQKQHQVAGWYELLFVRGRWVGPKTLQVLESTFNK